MCGTKSCRGYIGPKKREDRRTSLSTPKPIITKKSKKSKKRKNSTLDDVPKKKKRRNSVQNDVENATDSTTSVETSKLSVSITIDEDLEVKKEYFVPDTKLEDL